MKKTLEVFLLWGFVRVLCVLSVCVHVYLDIQVFFARLLWVFIYIYIDIDIDTSTMLNR